jgi:hypothetical protein
MCIRYSNLGLIVPDRRGQEQQVHLILVNNMINVIKNVCICAAYLTVCMIVSFVVTCAHMPRKYQAKHLKLGQPNLTEPVGLE